MRKLTVAVTNLSVWFNEEIFFDKANGIPIKLLTKTIPITEPKPKIKIKHIHPHTHEGGIVHTHPHEHNSVHKHTHKSYLIGCIHGLAGSGALVVVTAATLTSVQEVLRFILIFGFGSVIGMVLVSSLIGIPFTLSKKNSSLTQTLRFVTATVSFLIGCTIIYEVAFVEKLFNF